MKRKKANRLMKIMGRIKVTVVKMGNVKKVIRRKTIKNSVLSSHTTTLISL